MILFWLVFTVLVLAAIAAVTPALLRTRTAPDAEAAETETTVAVFRERLAELKRQRDEGALTSAEYDDAVAELERELAAEVPAEERTGPTTADPGPGRRALAVVAVALPVVAVAGYLGTGAPGLVAEPPATQMGSAEARRYARMAPAERIPVLERYVDNQPGTATAWVLLARAYHSTERFGEAVSAYERAHELLGEEPRLLAHWAESLAMANGRQLTPRVIELVDRALAGDPDNTLALWLAGSAAMNEGAQAEAAEHFRKLARQMRPGSESRRMVIQHIARAEGVSPDQVTIEGGAAQTAAAGPAFTVKVSLDPALAEQAEPGDTVFIFARSAEGPPMPVAAVRKRVADLPVTVTLSDAQAMMPARKLSGQERVIVGARVSKSGRPMPQPGDLQGTTQPVPVDGDRELSITIDERVQ